MEAQALNEGGFIAGPDGAIDWAAPDEELMRFHNEQTRQLGARLCGRGLYQDMLPAPTLVELDLIDEYRLFVSPVVLGGGTRYFPALDSRLTLELVETRTFGARVVSLSPLPASVRLGHRGPPQDDGGPALGTVPARAHPPPRIEVAKEWDMRTTTGEPVRFPC
jgi:hypothetical protein